MSAIRILILITFLASKGYAQSCPGELIFLKTTGQNGVCVEFDSDPVSNTISYQGQALSRQTGTNIYSNSNGNCQGNSPPNAPTTFLIGGLTCNYDANGILPVDLVEISVSIKNSSIIINWQTASETNNEVFQVERGSNLTDFEAIGEVLGNGTTNQSSKYEFLDRSPQNGTNYYRLKQIDFDGDFTYSKVVSAESKRAINIYRNFNSIFYESENDGVLQVFNLNGQLLMSRSFTEGFTLDLSEFGITNQVVIKIDSDSNQFVGRYFVY